MALPSICGEIDDKYKVNGKMGGIQQQKHP